MIPTISLSTPTQKQQRPQTQHSCLAYAANINAPLQFGFQKSSQGLPKWTQDIAPPTYSMPDLWPLSEELAENIDKLRRGKRDSRTLNQVQKGTLDIFRLYLKIQKELRYKGIP